MKEAYQKVGNDKGNTKDEGYKKDIKDIKDKNRKPEPPVVNGIVYFNTRYNNNAKLYKNIKKNVMKKLI